MESSELDSWLPNTSIKKGKQKETPSSPSPAKSKELDYLNGKKVKCIFTALGIFVVFAIVLWLLYWLKLIGNASCGHCLGDYITTKEEEEAKDLAKMKETEEKLKKMKDCVENNALDQLNVIVEHVKRDGN